MESIRNINWYPGHMKKTKELIRNNLKLVDFVVEVVDARIPMSSRNPIINELIGEKPRIIVLNKVDLADNNRVNQWKDYLEDEKIKVVFTNCEKGIGIKELFKLLNDFQKKKDTEKNNHKPICLMIVGVPNVGKSSLINRMTRRKATQIGNKPGITKGKQWITLENNMQLLDTPGILWPKFEKVTQGYNLAFCGAIKDDIMDMSELGLELIKVLLKDWKGNLEKRYNIIIDEIIKETEESHSDDSIFIDEENRLALKVMEEIALKRGFFMTEKRIDYERTGKTVLDEFRSGKIGKISLE